MISHSSSSISDYFLDNDGVEDFEFLPREYSISNPSSVVLPSSIPDTEEPDLRYLHHLNHLIFQILPNYSIDVNKIPSTVIDFIFQTDSSQHYDLTYQEVMLKKYIAVLHRYIVILANAPSLSKSSYIHNELTILRDFAETKNMSHQLIDWLDMLIAEAIDVYYIQLCDVVEARYISKSRTAEELVNSFIKKEVARLKMLTENTFSSLSELLIRKSIDTFPLSASSFLATWAKQNGIRVQ